MAKRIPQEFKDQHEPRFSRRMLGYHWNERPTYGWSFACSCGVKKQTNENKRECERDHSNHVRECYEKGQSNG